MLSLAIVLALWVMTAVTLWRLIVNWVQRLKNPKRPKRHPFAFLASFFGALALALNLDEVYSLLDGLVGERNLVDLAKHSCLILCGLFFVYTMRLAVGRLSAGFAALTVGGTLLVLGLQYAAFVSIDASPSTTEFMRTFGDQLPTVLYSATHFIYFGGAEVLALFTVLAVWRDETSRYRLALAALGAGASAAVLNVVVITVRDWARFGGATGLADSLDPIYKILLATIAVATCIGLALPAILGHRQDRQDDQFAADTLASLATTLDRVTLLYGELRPPLSADAFDLDHLSNLRAASIALRDAEAKGFALSANELASLRRAEALLS